MDSFIHRLLGWNTRTNLARRVTVETGSDYDVEKYAGSPVDADRKNAVKKSARASGTDSARALLCYTLSGERINLSEHARKCNKRKKKKNRFRFFRVSKDTEKVKHGKQSLSSKLEKRDDFESLRHKPALLLIPPQETLVLEWDDQLSQGVEEKSYNKYIPVDGLEKPVYKLTPFDRHYPLCWFDIQTWYREMRIRLQQQQSRDAGESEGVRATQSDTAVLDGDTDLTGQEEDGSDCGVESNLDCPKSLTDLLKDERFGEVINKQYCQVTSCKSPRYVIELFIQPLRQTDLHLCHLKTEMIVHCLQKFFYPFADVHVMWVHDLKCHALRLCSARGLRQHLPKPESTVDVDTDKQGKLIDEMEAMMIVSSDAAVLLKHEELCFMETLSVVTDIPAKKLIVFQQIRKSNQLAVIHELVN